MRFLGKNFELNSSWKKLKFQIFEAFQIRFGTKCEAKNLNPINDDLEIGMIKEVGNQFRVRFIEKSKLFLVNINLDSDKTKAIIARIPVARSENCSAKNWFEFF